MPKSPPPLFLARRAYRRRRMMDAARLLPLAGCVLMMLPALWHPATTPEPDTARGTVYLFGIWALLILAALALSKGLSAAMREEDEGDLDQGGEQTGGRTRSAAPEAAPAATHREMPDLGPGGPR